MSEATRNATSSPESADGATPSDSPDGMTLDLFGQEAAPASPFPARASKRATQTHVISGPSGFGSSASAALQQSLASRLQRQLDGAGSTLYRLTWKRRVTPSGRQYSQLAASAHRTNGAACGSWHTPQAADQRGATGPASKNSDLGRLAQLARGVAQLAAWPTVTAGDAVSARRHGYMDDGRERAAEKPRKEQLTGHAGTTLTDAVKFTAWTTPQAHDSSPRGKGQKVKHGTKHGCADLNADAAATLGPTSSGSPAATAKPGPHKAGQLNPRFSGFLMGYPASWDTCAMRIKSISRRSSKARRTESGD